MLADHDLKNSTGQDAYLIALDAGFSYREYRIGREGVVIGRDATSCDIAAAGATISRRHLRIMTVARQGKYLIIDLDSLNGVFVNGHKVKGSTVLTDGDLIGLGSESICHLRFQTTSNRDISWKMVLPAKKKWYIGRIPDADISLPFEPSVSSDHAVLTNCGDYLQISDRRSLNGTWLNGARIRQARVGKTDTVVIGSTYFHFRVNKDGSLTVHRRECGDDVKVECVGLTRDIRLDTGGNKRILNNITLALEPGEFVGILGPSGAGKTSLLKALNGFSPPSHGCVLLNETPLYHAYEMFRDVIGYVPQDDILHSELTVEKSLDYIARLRLPPDVSRDQRANIIDATIEALGLGSVRHIRINQLSGGQRKRVSIGSELITRPSVLFLDEPTSGLDPSVEEKLMRHFREMAHNGTSVLITTHILYNLDMLDRIILMAGGRLVFFGTPSEAIRFFSEKNGLIERPTQIFDLLMGEKVQDKGENSDNHIDNYNVIAEYYEQRYLKSEYYQRHIHQKLSDFAKDLQEETTSETGSIPQSKKTTVYGKLLEKPIARRHRKTNFFDLMSPRSWAILSRRQLDIRLVSIKKTLVYFLIPLVLALVTLSQNIIGFEADNVVTAQRNAVQEQVNRGGSFMAGQLKTLLDPDGVQNSRSAWEIVYAIRHEGIANLPIPIGVLLMFVMTAVFMGTILACLEISSEKSIYQRERMSHQRIIDYISSKLPFCLLITAVQCLVFLCVCSLNPDILKTPFLPVLLTMIVIAWTSVALGLAISAADPTPGRLSVVLAIIAVLPQLIFSGGLGPDFYEGMGTWSRHVADLFPARWGLEMLLTAVYDDISLEAVKWIPDFVSKVIGFDYGTSVYYMGTGILAVQTTGWLLLCALLLKRRDDF